VDIEVFTEPDELASLESEWDELVAECALPTPFLTHAWHRLWWKHCGQPGALFVVCVRHHGELVGVLPLCRETMRLRGLLPLRQMSFASGDAADYRDVLLRPGLEWEILNKLFEYLGDVCRRPGGVLTLRGLPALSRTHELLPTVAQQEGWFGGGRVAAPCPYVALPGSYEEYLASLSSSTRRKLQLKGRNLVKAHGEPLWRYAQGESITAEDIASFFRLHDLSWAERGGSKALTSPQLRAFHAELMGTLRGTVSPALAFLSLGTRDLGCIYGFTSRGVFYDYLPGFDPDFDKYSIGSQMLLRLIEFGIAQGWQELDLMRGDESYKFHYTRRCRHTLDYVLSPVRWRARLICAAEAWSQ
jgi:CelD/BcsL family acetyltransferase involved in cellulose biosynthesis